MRRVRLTFRLDFGISAYLNEIELVSSSIFIRKRLGSSFMGGLSRVKVVDVCSLHTPPIDHTTRAQIVERFH